MTYLFPPVVVTKRLVLRPWTVEDAPMLKRAIDDNLEHLQAWMPWAMNEPSPLEAIEQRIVRFAKDFAVGTDGVYGIFMRDEMRAIGGTGLHGRIDDGLEIGYWIAAQACGRGFATEAAGALTAAAFAIPGVELVQIRCDPANVISAAIPRRLGFTHWETLRAETVTPSGAPRDTMVWQMLRARFRHADD